MFILASSGVDSTGGIVTQVFTGLAAIIAAISAYRLNRRDQDTKELQNTKRKLSDLQQDLLTLRGFIFAIRAQAADRGVQLPDPPRLRSEEWD